MKIAIHANQIDWQRKYAKLVARGLRRHGIKDIQITPSPNPVSCDIAVLMGPNSWTRIENEKRPFFMLNRKLIGNDPKIVHENCAISWNGFNGYGQFCVGDVNPKRLEKYLSLKEITNWQKNGVNMILCEQSNVGRSKRFKTLQHYYNFVNTHSDSPIIFRKKPIGEEKISYDKFKKQMHNIKALISLNSTISIEALVTGIPTITLDEGDPSFAITSHNLNHIIFPERLPYFQYLAHCQWHTSEIESGEFWEHIYPAHGPKLHEWKHDGS